MTELWIDIKYANLLGTRLKRFKVKSSNPYIANCRCDICGDSAKNKLKARGYIFQVEGKLRYRCHNCSASYNFKTFLKISDPLLYDEYVVECFGKKHELPVYQSTEPEFSFPEYLKKGEPLSKLIKVSQLSWNHPVKQYVVRRKIPNFYHSRLFFAENFPEWVNSIIPGKLDETRAESRLVIPFFDEYKEMFAFTGRALDNKNKKRYIAIVLDKSKPAIYGLDTVVKEKRVYVVEGPIDSMFLYNSVAMGSTVVSLPDGFNDTVYILDNQPRNPEIIKVLDKYIARGHNVCIWPSNIVQKDINEMVLAGMDPEHIQQVINTNTFSGLMAQAKLSEWRKV